MMPGIVAQDCFNIRLLEPSQFEAAESLQEECKDFYNLGAFVG